jgi:hypothetical protein
MVAGSVAGWQVAQYNIDHDAVSVRLQRRSPCWSAMIVAYIPGRVTNFTRIFGQNNCFNYIVYIVENNSRHTKIYLTKFLDASLRIRRVRIFISIHQKYVIAEKSLVKQVGTTRVLVVRQIIVLCTIDRCSCLTNIPIDTRGCTDLFTHNVFYTILD